jgi:hypothetical protein
MKTLITYLNDHLTGSVAAVELLNHLIAGSQDISLKQFLMNLLKEIEEDQRVLRELLKQLGGEESTIRKAGAWILEKIAQLKFPSAEKDDNGFGVFEALEGLALGIAGKCSLWRTLATVNIPDVPPLDYERLRNRATEQLEKVQAQCLKLAPTALSIG